MEAELVAPSICSPVRSRSVDRLMAVLFLFYRFPDNFEKLSPPILQLDEVEFYYTPDQRLFSGLNLSADLESRICIVRICMTISRQ